MERMAAQSRIGIVLLLILLLASIPLHAKKKFEEIAHYYLDILNYEEAVFYYRQALERNPKKKNIKDKLGYAYFKMGRIEEAIKTLREEMIRYPSNLDGLILLCLVYAHQGNEAEVKRMGERYHRAFQMVLQREKKKLSRKYRLTEDTLRVLAAVMRQRNPNLGLPYFLLGLYAKEEGDVEEAEDNFIRAHEAGYDPVECYIQFIDIPLEQNNWQEAVLISRDAQRAFGENDKLYVLRGYAQFHDGQVNEAVFCFKKALEYKPFSEEALKNLALVHLKKDRRDLALPLLDRYLKLIPVDYEIAFLKERLELNMPDISATGEQVLTKKLADDILINYVYVFQTEVQTITDDVNYKAIALLRSGQHDLAIGYLRGFLEIYDRSPVLNYNLAQFLSMKNEWREALPYAWKAAELKTNFKEAIDLVGSIFLKLGDFENSISSFQKVIAIDPQDAIGHYNLGCAYSADEQFRAAEDSWRLALRLDSSASEEEEKSSSAGLLSETVVVEVREVSFNCHMALGELLAKQDRDQEALMQYQAARVLEPRNADVYFEIGKHYLKMELPEKAKESFETYLSLGGKKGEEVNRILESIKK